MPLPTTAPQAFTLLFAARIFRLFAYGFLGLVLVLYLRALGYAEARVGVLLAFTLLGDAAISLTITTRADRLGRRRMLLLGAGPLMGIPAVAGWCFVISGALKSAYDLVIWRAFNHVKPPEER
jgi:MFS family permease